MRSSLGIRLCAQRGFGCLQNREVGTVKVTMPMAWSTAMLAWGLQDFQPGYNSSGAYAAAILNVKWGTDYLLKTIIGNTSTPTTIELVWQVRCGLIAKLLTTVAKLTIVSSSCLLSSSANVETEPASRYQQLDRCCGSACRSEI